MAEEDKLRDAIERLKAELEALRSMPGAQIQDGAAAIGDHAKAVGAGGMLIEGGIYFGPPAQDPKKALAIYRRMLVQTTANLPLRGVDVGSADPTVAQKSIGLTNVYVSLDTTVLIVKIEVKERTKQIRAGEIDLSEERESLSALQSVIQNRRLVILGDPGGGKSTIVNFLAHCLAANALEPEAGWMEHLPGWPINETQILPVLIILRDFARSLPQPLPGRAEPHHIWDFILARLQAQKLEFVADAIHQKLEEGQALVLLDGLDEVPTQEQRVFVRDAVRTFIQRYPENRTLITCRVLSYQQPRSDHGPDLRLGELPDFILAPFDEEKIDSFIKGWYVELARLGNVPSSNVDGLTQQLQFAVRRPDLWRLASNPLLLTVMALVHTHKGRLPEARALLYEETVDILLWRWEQLKLTDRKDAPNLQQLLLDAGRSDVDLKRVLWELAYEAHARVGLDPDEDKLADIGELRLQKSLATLKDGDYNWARQVIDAMKLRAGLLLERSPEVFTFPHRTFQEYLAGAHLASQANFANKACELAIQGTQWREVILLAVGRLVYLVGDQDKPLALVGELCPMQVLDEEIAWKKAWLAGDVLLEIGTSRVKDSALGRDLLQRVREKLVDLLAASKLVPIERTRAGDTLAQLGDLRFDPQHWHLPAEPMLGFVEIPAGSFRMGSDPNKDEETYHDEEPPHKVRLATFYIARYPVTVAQFRSFVDTSGYKFDRWRLNPMPNHPVVDVTWFDALAYCRWLQEKLIAISQQRSVEAGIENSARSLWEGLIFGKLKVTLPSEAEWEKVARGTDGQLYPWGDDFDPDNANTSEIGLSNTSPVGCFIEGASLYGVLDLSGNVWEWTRSKYEKYPYKATDGRENLIGDALRVRRGGSFANVRRRARCAYRFKGNPVDRLNIVGFRVVVSPA